MAGLKRESDMDTFLCNDARPLIPAWADGELSEAQAAPLRSHLLACRACRAAMQDVRALKRWFEAGRVEDAELVPPGFAARVARRAFAGDTGERGRPLEAGRERAAVLHFVLQVTSLAAVLVIALAVGLGVRELPQGERLGAETPGLSTQKIVERLDALEDESAQPAPTGGRGEPSAPVEEPAQEPAAGDSGR